MTGPTAAFEGRHGVFDQVTGPFTLDALGAHPRGSGLERTGIKQFPTEYHSQIPLGLALELRKNFRPEEIEAVHVQTYHLAWSEIGSEPEKWDPRTRETADHSLPYMLAAALQDGAISVHMFDEVRIRDPALRPLMNRIKVSENPHYTREFPRLMHNRIEIATHDGRTYTDEGVHPHGHVEHPLSDAEVEAKFRALCADRLGTAQCERALDTIRHLDTAADLGALFDLVRIETTTTD
jgi:2-methylcitrate dehydratase